MNRNPAHPSRPVAPSHRRRHVLLIVETTMSFGRGVLEGISRFLVEHPRWSVQLDLRELQAAPPAWLDRWKGDGIITRSTTPEMAEVISKRGIPTVNLTDIYGQRILPSIWNDHDAIGRAAADHLLERGLTQFAYCGFSDHHWSKMRYTGFADQLARRRYDCKFHTSDWALARRTGWERQQAKIVRWLQSLAKPIGIMACNDFRGQHVLEACRESGISVPEEVAVIGVDNDSVICDLCQPPLTSVIPAAERIGYQAAAMLDQLMNGSPLVNQHVTVAPLGVAARQSTDILEVGDADVVAALKIIRDRACLGLTVKEVVREVAVARSSLERRFRKYFGRSPQAEIRNVQIKKAQHLLRETDLPLAQIAALTGFKHAEYFSVVFKRECRQTPGHYRATSR
jgi:LacI family transcriptional regulator